MKYKFYKKLLVPVTGYLTILTYPLSAQWSKVGSAGSGAGTDSFVYAMAPSGTKLYVGGDFTLANYNTSTGTTVNYIAMWDGTNWNALKPSGGTAGTSGDVFALTVDGSGNVYAGGSFTTVNGGTQTVNRIAIWNPTTSTWSALTTAGSGIGINNGIVYALAYDASNGIIWIGGTFTKVNATSSTTTTVNHVVGWKPSTSSWVTLTPSGGSAGVSGPVYALAPDGSGSVYVGGQYTNVNTSPVTAVNNVAKWNQSTTAWSALGTGTNVGVKTQYFPTGQGGFNYTNALVLALAYSSAANTLFVGGDFKVAGPGITNDTNLASYNSSTNTWAKLNPGGVGGTFALGVQDDAEVMGLTLYNGGLFVGGDFDYVGGSATNQVYFAAYYSGSGYAALPAPFGVSAGLTSEVYCIAVCNGVLYVGGQFSTWNSGDVGNNIDQYSATSPLPVKLISFNADYDNNSGSVNLNWSTASEINCKEFIVEKSTDGQNWKAVVTIQGAGNSSARLDYLAADDSPYLGTSYYRLKQIDYDGNLSYSEVKTVTVEGTENSVSIVPNPAKANVRIVFNTVGEDQGQINIYDCTGRLVISKTIIVNKGINTISLDVSGINTGVYLVAICTSRRQYTSKMVIDKE